MGIKENTEMNGMADNLPQKLSIQNFSSLTFLLNAKVPEKIQAEVDQLQVSYVKKTLEFFVILHVEKKYQAPKQGNHSFKLKREFYPYFSSKSSWT